MRSVSPRRAAGARAAPRRSLRLVSPRSGPRPCVQQYHRCVRGGTGTAAVAVRAANGDGTFTVGRAGERYAASLPLARTLHLSAPSSLDSLIRKRTRRGPRAPRYYVARRCCRRPGRRLASIVTSDDTTREFTATMYDVVCFTIIVTTLRVDSCCQLGTVTRDIAACAISNLFIVINHGSDHGRADYRELHKN